MRYPPRLSHLATRAVLVSRLWPTWSRALQVDEAVARERLDAALRGRALEDLLSSTWTALRATSVRLSDEKLVDKVAKAVDARPFRSGKAAADSPGISAWLLSLDPSTTDAARRALEGATGREALDRGLAEIGAHLARELVR